ncbi:hypothetical protein D3C71_1289280 [compost metagenome]
MLAADDQRHHGARLQVAFYGIDLCAIEPQRDAIGARLKLQRQHPHTNQVGAVDAFKALGHHYLHTRQAHALGGPVAAGALAVVGTGNDDERLAAVQIGIDGLPHAHHLAFGLHAGERSFFYLAIDHRHFVDELRVGKRGA